MIKQYSCIYSSGKKLYIRGVDEKGNRNTEEVDYSPTVWVPLAFNYSRWKHLIKSVDSNKYRAFFDESKMVALTFNDIGCCNEFIKDNSSFDAAEGHLRLNDNIFTSPNNRYESQYLCENYPLEMHFDLSKFRILFYDIETEVGHRNVSDDTVVLVKKDVSKKDEDSLWDNESTNEESKPFEITIKNFEQLPNQDQYYLYDQTTDRWVRYSSHPYRFIGGFPEPETAAEKITLITVKDINNNSIYTWSLFDFKSEAPNINYQKFDDEKDLLRSFLKWFVGDYPDILVGFNSNQFDNLYLANRITNVLGGKFSRLLSPFHKISKVKRKDPKTFAMREECTFKGISCLDYLKLYKKWGSAGQRESYKLDSIGEDEVGVKKVPNPTGGSFRNFYTGEFDVATKPSEHDDEILKLGYARTVLKQKRLNGDEEASALFDKVNKVTIQRCQQRFVEYNIRDVELIEIIERKLKLLDICIAIAYNAHANFEEAFSPVKTWDYIIYNTLERQGIVIPRDEFGEKNAKYPGAYVKNIQGIFQYCASFDLDSEYPHCIMGVNISPETILNDAKGNPVKVDVDLMDLVDKKSNVTPMLLEKDLCISGSGVCFRRDKQGILPYLCEKYYSERKKNKKTYLMYKQEHEKVATELRKRGFDVAVE